MNHVAMPKADSSFISVWIQVSPRGEMSCHGLVTNEEWVQAEHRLIPDSRIVRKTWKGVEFIALRKKAKREKVAE